MNKEDFSVDNEEDKNLKQKRKKEGSTKIISKGFGRD